MLIRRFKFILLFKIFLLLFNLPLHSQKIINRNKPMNIIFLIDQSGSMEFTGRNLMEPVRTGIREAITGNIQVNDEIVLVGGNDNPSILYHKRIINQNDIQEVLAKIDTLRAIKDCATDMTSWMEFTSKEVEPIFLSDDVMNREKTILYIITDGENLPNPNSKYLTKDNSFHPAMEGFVNDILVKKWQINVIGIGFKTDAKKLSEALRAAVYEVSENNARNDVREIIRQALKNNIQISKSSAEYTFRRGANNEILLNVTGGWDYGEFDIEEAYITFPASSKNKVRLEYNDGKVGLTPSDTKKISFNYKLPIDNNLDGIHDGLLEIIFKEGTTAEPSNLFFKAKTEHWFNKHIPLLSFITGVIFFIIIVVYWYLKTPFYASITVDGEQIAVHRFTNNSKYTLNDEHGLNGSITVTKQNQNLIVTGCSFDESEGHNPFSYRGKEIKSKELKGKNIFNVELKADGTSIRFKSSTKKKYESFIKSRDDNE